MATDGAVGVSGGRNARRSHGGRFENLQLTLAFAEGLTDFERRDHQVERPHKHEHVDVGHERMPNDPLEIGVEIRPQFVQSD